jgi:3-oxoisoapionate decarboxylase
MRIGTTSFGFRYQLLDESAAPPLTALVDQAAEAGLDCLQICENARPLKLSVEQWTALQRHAADAGIAIGLGCKTTDLGVFQAYLDRAAGLPERMLRLVFEEEQGAPPSRSAIDKFLQRAAPLLESRGVRLAIENHFDVPSSVLSEAAAPYPPELIGFCVDTANSLRNFESPEQVFDALERRAVCYHIKDYAVDGHLLGFAVTGVPLGRGRLRLRPILERIFAVNPEPDLYVENWVPATGDRDRDIAEDAAWLRASLHRLRSQAVELRQPHVASTLG